VTVGRDSFIFLATGGYVLYTFGPMSLRARTDGDNSDTHCRYQAYYAGLF
jgi:hypothetical protein